MSWDTMCMTKNKGGLTSRSLHSLNLAILGKNIWHFLNKFRIFKGRYYPENHLLKAQKGSDASFI